MQFGVALPNFAFGAPPTRQHLLAVARAAEESGYRSIWASDHILVGSDFPRYGALYEVMVTLSWLAAKTETIRVGTSVLVLPIRNAILAAKQAATLDDLCGGRFVLGVGVGWNQGEYGFLKAPWNERGRLTDESLAVIRALWSSERPTFSGQFYDFRDALFYPKPAQAGGPPIWVGGGSDRALRRAARWGDAWHGDEVMPEAFAAALTKLRGYAAEQGRTVAASIRFTVDAYRAAGEKQAAKGPAGADLGEWAEIGMRGSFSDMVDFARRYRDLGASDFICQFEHDSVERHLEFIRIFSREVMARV